MPMQQYKGVMNQRADSSKRLKTFRKLTKRNISPKLIKFILIKVMKWEIVACILPKVTGSLEY